MTLSNIGISEQLWILRFRIVISGDTRVNPEPKRNSNLPLDLKLKLKAHSFAKVLLLTVYLSVNKFDILCLSETFLHYEILTDDENFQIPAFSIARVDHRYNTKRCGVCLLQDLIPFEAARYKLFSGMRLP